MPTDKRFDSAVKIQAGFNRFAASIARLSFWQFVLLAIILLAAAGIVEDFWDQPAKHRIRITDERPAAAAGQRDAATRKQERGSAEIRIDENGVVIRSRTTPNDQGSNASTGGSAPIKITPDQIIPQDQRSSASTAAQGPKVTGTEDITLRARRPPLSTIALLLVLVLFVMRMFARAQQRAEHKADAAVAVADHETLQRQIVEARLQLLQAQVEPHFLFNTLAAVEHLIETAPARAAQMQRHLIEYLRAALPRMRQQSATLGQEIELCVSYLKIMQMRMEERLQFEVAVPAGLSSASFPPMMIQSLVENSIRHGLEPKPEGGSINLHAEVRDGKLCVTVEDTGMGFSTAAPAGIGLANIRERLRQLFGAAATLAIEPGQPRGTRATIAVPYAVA